MVIFNVSPPSGVFSITTFMQEILAFSWTSRVSLMMITLLFPSSVALGRTRTFFIIKVEHILLEKVQCPPVFPKNSIDPR
jgi:hypothetical protein